METGKTVVLLNLENLYESLYDALNQVCSDLYIFCITKLSFYKCLITSNSYSKYIFSSCLYQNAHIYYKFHESKLLVLIIVPNQYIF